MREFLDTLTAWATTTGIKIVIALVVLFISFKLINWICKKILKACEKKHADKTIAQTLTYALKLLMKIVVVICLIGYLGIDTSALTALVASLGVCIGLAVNGTLSNLAGGVLILTTRPFKIDDFIEAQGISGTVADIRITHTKVVTPDNKVVHIPNGALSSGNVINYSEKETRRVEHEFSIAYDSDAEKAKKIISDIIAAHELVLKDPEPFVRICEHGSSAIKIMARAWVNSADFWTVHFDILESVKNEFDKNGIAIPYQQVDVHIKNN